MKPIAFTLVLLIVGSLPTLAHGDKLHQAVAYASAAEALSELQKQIIAIEQLASEGKLGDNLHDISEYAQSAAQAVADKANVAADKKPRLESAAKQLIAQLGKLHEAVDGNNKGAVDTEIKKLKSALKLVEAYSK